MLLRSLPALAGLCLLSACTIPLWGENDADKTDPSGGLPSSRLEVPPDLTRPASSQTYEVPRAPSASATADSKEAAPVAVRDLEARMKELQELRDKGLITDQELQAKRKALLDSL